MEEKEKNPEIVLDALTQGPKEFAKFKLNPLTIFRYAFLEKIKSPFVDSSKEFSVENVAPTVFVLASDRADLRKYSGDPEALKLDALEWADDHLSIDEVPDVIKAVVAQFAALNKAAPSAQAGDDGKKK